MFKRFADITMAVAAAAVYCAFCIALPLRCPDYFSDLNRKISVVVSSGMSAGEASLEIQKAGVVDSASLLVDAMKLLKIDKNLKPGVYELVRGTPSSVALQLKTARPQSLKITLIPGVRFKDFAVKVGGDKTFGDALADDLNFPADVRRYLPANAAFRIIFLLPETYYLSPGQSEARQFVQRASKLWYEKTAAMIPAGAASADVLKTGILASIVEGEAKVESDRPILAGIFLKRMEKAMRLQSCATVVYCWEQRGVKKRRLAYDDLKIASPYNTYVNAGLPPGPICVPSIQSWQSAFKPEKTDYLFFFANGSGRHIFSKTYEEHLKKQKELLK